LMMRRGGHWSRDTAWRLLGHTNRGGYSDTLTAVVSDVEI